MTTAGTGTEDAWARLATAQPEERSAQVQARYHERAGLPEDERRSRLDAMIRSEYALPDEQLHAMTLCRLETYLQMQPDEVRTIVASVEAVMNTLPGSFAMRRVALVQTLSREFSVEDQQRLRELVPEVFGDSGGRAVGAAPAPPPAAASPKRAWWTFWKKN